MVQVDYQVSSKRNENSSEQNKNDIKINAQMSKDENSMK